LESLYRDVLGSDKKQLEEDAIDIARAGQGIDTGYVMHSRAANGDMSEFNLRIPKYAITMITARTGSGKTTWMTNLANRMAMDGASGLFITLEEPRYSIRGKMLASFTKEKNKKYSMNALTPWQAMKANSGKQECPVLEEFNKKIMRKVRVVDANRSVPKHSETPGIFYQPQYIGDLIKYRNSKSQAPLDFVIIDFGQLMETLDSDNSNSYQRMKGVMQACKNLSGSLGIAVVIGAQLQRQCAAINIWDFEPEHIRDGSDMEQAASLILATGMDKNLSEEDVNMVLRILKNRNGPKRVGGFFDIDFEHNHIPLKSSEPKYD